MPVVDGPQRSECLTNIELEWCAVVLYDNRWKEGQRGHVLTVNPTGGTFTTYCSFTQFSFHPLIPSTHSISLSLHYSWLQIIFARGDMDDMFVVLQWSNDQISHGYYMLLWFTVCIDCGLDRLVKWWADDVCLDCGQVGDRVWIPGLPFPGRSGILVIFPFPNSREWKRLIPGEIGNS